MRIGGIQKLTLLDYPGKVACTVFLGSIRAHELRAKPNSDLMLDKKLVCKVIRCIDDCEVVVEE